MATVVASVLANLTPLLLEEVQQLRSLRWEIESLNGQFQLMMNFLERVELVVQYDPDLRTFVDLVRDSVYDVEDVLDEFVMRTTYRVAHVVNIVLDESLTQHMSRHFSRLLHLFKKKANSIGAIVAQRQLASKIQKIKKRVREISDTHERYRIRYQDLLPERAFSTSISPMWHDKRGDALFLEEEDLVGIEVPKKELIDMLLNGDKRRNVISVVGMGGLGKTTLVKKVYDDVSVQGQFDHHAWITVSESFKLEVLFKDAIKQLFDEDHRQIPQDVDDMNIQRLRGVVRDFLQTKKYIVVFDDVWNINHWDAIHLAFPKNQFCSRVMTTTRNKNLGEAVSTTEAGGLVYPLRPLPDTQARQLFCRKAFSGAISCPNHLEEISNRILSACEGLPLAIEVIGSVLARKSQLKEEWELFYNSLSDEMDRNSQLESIWALLSLSYYDLPNHLKICFLYLSIFPEDARVMKEDLVQLWIAEGFVEKKSGWTLEEVAYSYLKELVDRCLLQVALVDLQEKMKVFHIHDMIRRIIVLKASEQNIATICGEE